MTPTKPTQTQFAEASPNDHPPKQVTKRISDPELQAMAQMNEILLGLEEAERFRTLAWLNDRHGITVLPTVSQQPGANRIPCSTDGAET